MRYETKPGEQGQFDWSPYTVMIEDKPVKIQVFCFILGCTPIQKKLMKKLESALDVINSKEIEDLNGCRYNFRLV